MGKYTCGASDVRKKLEKISLEINNRKFRGTLSSGMARRMFLIIIVPVIFSVFAFCDESKNEKIPVLCTISSIISGIHV